MRLSGNSSNGRSTRARPPTACGRSTGPPREARLPTGRKPDVSAQALANRLGRIRCSLRVDLSSGDSVAVRLGMARRRAYESRYFMMIVGVYATLGVFLLNA